MTPTQSPARRVIVTRPAPDGAAFADQLAAAGMAAILSPVMTIRPRPLPADARAPDAAAFTSANGVRAAAAGILGRDLAVFAVGDATAQAAHAEGFTNVHVATGDVAALAALIAARRAEAGRAGEVVHFGGESLAGDLVGRLAERGVAARRVVAYVAEPAAALAPAARAALAAPGRGLWVAHFSPRSARLFLGLVDAAGLAGSLGRIAAACLSPAVAAAAEPSRWARLVVAARSDTGALIEAIRAPR
jgi:uroporphyrinogen-III synthase